MPDFEFSWVMRGTASVEADDMADAEQELVAALEGFDTFVLDAVDVDDVHITDGVEVEE